MRASARKANSGPVEFTSLADSGLCRYEDFKAYIGGLHRSTIMRGVAAGTFPQPRRISSRLSVWCVGDVRAWVNGTWAGRDGSGN